MMVWQPATMTREQALDRRATTVVRVLSHAARVAPTPTLKTALLRCVANDRLSFWAAPALVDLWGAADVEVRTALLAAAEWPG
jgi:hypothetical protein